MNKKKLTMITSLILGGTLLLGTVFVNAQQLSGYESYKTAVMNTKNLNNETAAVKATITDNGTVLAEVNSNVKVNTSADAMSNVTTVKAGSTTQSFSSYRQDGKNITKDSSSNVYTVREGKRDNFKELKKVQNPQIEKSMEVIVDTLVGSMKDKVTVENGKVTIALNESDVTPLVNAVTSMAFAGMNENSNYKGKGDLKDIKSSIPQLQSDIKVVSVNSTADIANNVVNNQVAKVVITGKDAQGKSHEIDINVNLDLSNINSTTPDKINLTGKQVKTVADKFRGHEN